MVVGQWTGLLSVPVFGVGPGQAASGSWVHEGFHQQNEGEVFTSSVVSCFCV